LKGKTGGQDNFCYGMPVSRTGLVAFLHSSRDCILLYPRTSVFLSAIYRLPDLISVPSGGSGKYGSEYPPGLKGSAFYFFMANESLRFIQD